LEHAAAMRAGTQRMWGPLCARDARPSCEYKHLRTALLLQHNPDASWLLHKGGAVLQAAQFR
jgi:hypothetical protein